MAIQLIPDLPAATSLATTDLLVKDTGSATQKIAVSNAYATASNPGLVSTTTQTFAGTKTINGSLRLNPTTRRISVSFRNGAEEILGEVYLDKGSNTNFTDGKFIFSEYSPKTTADASSTGYYENFRLPSPTAGLATNANYDILTTKDFDFGAKNIGTVDGATSAVLTVPSSSFHLLIAISNTSGYQAALICGVNGNGTVYRQTLASGSNLTISSTTNQITFAKAGSALLRVYDLILAGNAASLS